MSSGEFRLHIIWAVISLLIVVWFVILLRPYVTWFWRSASERRRFHFTGVEPATLRNVGLESSVIETLPVFIYKSNNFADALQCAVCLCQFEENEKGRILPNCGHSFHVECIDMWFLSHSTCPLCRTGVQTEQEFLESAKVPQISVTIPGPIPSEFHDNLNSEQTHGSTSSGDCRNQEIRKPDADE